MIGQLQNNFRKIRIAVILFSAVLAIPMTVVAEDTSVELVATDWVILVKSENSVFTELSRHTHGPFGYTEISTTLSLNISAGQFDENYLYIVAGNRHDGLLPYLAGRLRGNRTLITNNSKIEVMDSGFNDHKKLPRDIGILEEIITGGFGGGPYGATTAVEGKYASIAVKGDTFPSAWSHNQREQGAANVFRIPYSALFNPPSDDKGAEPDSGNEVIDSGGNNGGVTVNLDVGGLLGSLFGNKDKDKDTQKEEIDSDTASQTETINDDDGTSSSTTSTITDNSNTSSGTNIESDSSDGSTSLPEIITQYVPDPDIIADRDRLLEERPEMVKAQENMRDYITGLTNVIKEREATIRELNNDLTFAQNGVNSLPAIVTPLHEKIATQQAKLLQNKDELAAKVEEISGLETRIDALEKAPKAFPRPALIAGGLGLLGLGGLAGLRLGRKRHNKTCERHLPPLKREEEEREKSQGFETLAKGMAFSASPMMLGGLPPALAIIKPVYDAVGRIGFAQQGKPTGKDESFGTGILISERHVLTNRHVWEMFKHRLESDEPTGIEFYGEKESDKSDFVTFDDIEPVCVEGWDAAIFTLTRAPENRKPVTITPRPAEDLNDLDIVVVGYPQAHRVTEEIADVTEKDPIFGVKRYSEGKIFRHSVDIENPYGVEAAVESVINPSEAMRAICHNASTLGGSSGSAVIDKKTGELIALHFGFDSAYEWEEAANFAVAGENLADKVNEITNTVTPVTDKSET